MHTFETGSILAHYLSRLSFGLSDSLSPPCPVLSARLRTKDGGKKKKEKREEEGLLSDTLLRGF